MCGAGRVQGSGIVMEIMIRQNKLVWRTKIFRISVWAEHSSPPPPPNVSANLSLAGQTIFVWGKSGPRD